MLAKMKTGKLAYVGRVQLINWVFSGKVNYWIHVYRLPKKTVRRIRAIGYVWVLMGSKEGHGMGHDDVEEG